MKKFFRFFAVLAALIVSCQKTGEIPEPQVKPQLPETKLATSGLNLSSLDAVSVAKHFYTRKVATRSGAEMAVRNVVTIPDEAGEPAIYAVNLEDGYLLVSATKSYYPILAQVDHGTFSLDGERTGQDVIIQEMLDDIRAARDSVTIFDCRHAWFPYEERSLPERKLTRASDDFYAMQDEWYQKWYDGGYETYYLRRQPDNLPDDIYQSFCTTAMDLDPWADTEYNCMNYVAIITEKTYDLGNMKGPFVYANWDQGAPFNSDLNGDYPLGCVTVAVGQLMRYYEHPAYFGWSDMPCRGSCTPTLTAFLAKLRKELKVDDGGGTSDNDAEKVLDNYGYNCKKIDHSGSEVYSALQHNMPVYASGEDRKRNKGHAWVIDGTNTITSYTEYELYILNDCAYPQFEYIRVDSWRDYHVQNVFFHMNWGWGGDSNGWFLDSRIGFDTDNGEHIDYYAGRKDIIIKGY